MWTEWGQTRSTVDFRYVVKRKGPSPCSFTQIRSLESEGTCLMPQWPQQRC